MVVVCTRCCRRRCSRKDEEAERDVHFMNKTNESRVHVCKQRATKVHASGKAAGMHPLNLYWNYARIILRRLNKTSSYFLTIIEFLWMPR